MLTLLLITILISFVNAIDITYLNIIKYPNNTYIHASNNISTNIPVFTFTINHNDTTSSDNESNYEWMIWTI